MRIAIVQTRPGIGDMCLFLPFIHIISKIYSKKIFLFTKSRSKSKDLLKYDPHIKKIIYIDEDFKNKNFFDRVSLLKNFSFEKVFIFSYGFKYPFLFKLSKTKKIFYYGLFKKNNSIFQDAKNFLERTQKNRNFEIKCKLFLKNKNITKSDTCVIGIGGSGPTKKWPINNYQNLILELKKKGINKFIIAGGENEKEDFKKLSDSLNGVELISLCEKSLEDSIQEISKAKMYVGNDTGFMHISGLCGLKTFGLFGDTPTNYATYNPIIKTIIPDGYKKVGHNSKAIDKISVEKVISEISLY